VLGFAFYLSNSALRFHDILINNEKTISLVKKKEKRKRFLIEEEIKKESH
jgi:hypothetical protein